MTKMTRDQARAYHPSMTPIWTPDDFDQTVRDAQAVVKAGKRRVRIVGEDERGAPTLLFSQSRERKARRLDALAVALLMALMAALGCIVLLASAPHAKADVPSDAAIEYASEYGGLICQVLDEHASVPGLMGVMQGVYEDGWTPYEAGQITGLSIYAFCPEHSVLIDRFVNMYGAETGAANIT